MTSQLRHYDASDSWQEILQGIAADGGVIVENLLGADLLQRVTTELAPHAAGVTPGMSGGQIKPLAVDDYRSAGTRPLPAMRAE